LDDPLVFSRFGLIRFSGRLSNWIWLVFPDIGGLIMYQSTSHQTYYLPASCAIALLPLFGIMENTGLAVLPPTVQS
jgi:hypothetical protein